MENEIKTLKSELEYYQKSIADINNTTIGNKAVRRKNFQQIMKESFFYGANRFGNNFIA